MQAANSASDKPAKPSLDSLKEPERLAMQRAAKSDPLLAGMIRDGNPLTREVYLSLNGMKEPLDAEEEAMLPEPFRKG